MFVRCRRDVFLHTFSFSTTSSILALVVVVVVVDVAIVYRGKGSEQQILMRVF